MRHLWIPMGAMALSIALTAGCKRPTETSTSETRSATAPPTTTTGATAITEDDKEFMTKAAQGGMLEVTLGREIAKNARSADVKKLGAMLESDHTKANEELKQLAARKGVTLPTELDADHREKVADITKLTGEKMSKEYVDDMVDDHEDDVKMFREAATEAKDPDVRAYAAKTLPTLEHHLQLSKSLKSKLEHGTAR